MYPDRLNLCDARPEHQEIKVTPTGPALGSTALIRLMDCCSNASQKLRFNASPEALLRAAAQCVSRDTFG